MMNCSIVEITWLDHSSTHSGWQSLENDVAGPCLIKSIGYVIKDKIEYFVLCDTIDVTPELNNQTGSQRTILKTDIKAIRILDANTIL